MMLKILAVINGWRDKTIRGGDYHTLMVLYHWSKTNHISLIMPKLGYRSVENMLNYEHFIHMSSNKEMETDCLIRLILSYLRRIIRSLSFQPGEDIDIIIASSHMLYDIVPSIILGRRLEAKLVIYVHHLLGSFRKYKDGTRNSISLICEKMSLLLCRKADLIFVMNRETRDLLTSKGLSADKIYITGNAVDYDFIDSVKAQKKIFDVCFCGRLIKRKGVYDLIEIWQRVLKYFPLSRLAIIGQGPEYYNLLKIVKRDGMDKAIVFAGYISEREKFLVMKSSKLFVFPSYEEGWGIAIREAIACKLQVICYDLTSYKILGDNIIRVQIGNKEAMAKIIIRKMALNKVQIDSDNTAKKADLLLDWSKIAIQELNEIEKM